MAWRENIGGWGLPPYQNHVDATRTALIVVDMQYANAHPDHGLGRILREHLPEAASPYFDRIDQVVVPNIQRLLAFFREHGLPVIHLTLGSEQEDGTDLLPRLRRRNSQIVDAVGVLAFPVRGSIEHQVIPQVAPERGEMTINKTSFGAFNSTGIDQILRNAGITGLVFAGVATNICVETTARDAADRGYDCILVEDACASTDHAMHEATLITFARSFGDVRTTQAVVSEFARALK